MSEFEITDNKIQAGKEHIISRIKRRLSFKKEKTGLQPEKEPMGIENFLDIFTMTKNAQKDWENAWAFFNEAKDEGMVEEAIYELMAAEQRFNYFLKLAKAHNIRNGGVPT